MAESRAKVERLQSRSDNAVCRCCLLEGTFGTMERSYCWPGYTQTYSNMLRDMFGINLTQDHGAQLICGLCEIRLRQAFTFWRQVLNSNKMLIKLKPTIVSEEHIASKEKTSTLKEFTEVESENVVPDTSSEEDMNNFDDDAPISTITEVYTSSYNDSENQPKLAEATVNNGGTQKHTQNSKRQSQLISTPNMFDEILFKTNHVNGLNYTTLNCIFCSKLFENELDFTCHSRTCEQRSKKILPKKCPFCPTTFEADTILISKHMWMEHRYKTEHFKQPWLKCDICPRIFSNILKKVLHVRRSHHTCHNCGKTFLNMYEKKEHELLHPVSSSTHPKPFYRKGSTECPECKEVFTSVKFCQVHVRRKHGSRCGICKERFFGSNTMLRHKVEAHGKSMVNCDACDKSYYTQSKLRVHQRRYHMQEKNFSCPQCDFVAYSQSCINKHMISHTKDKAYVCPYCSKRFSRTSTLSFHKRIHTGDKQKVCKVCGQAFVQRASLKYHMEKYHPGEL